MEYKDMELKDIIKLRRKELNLNLLDVAKACNVSEATVSRWESGNIGQMKRNRIAALSKVLDLSPAILVGTTENNVDDNVELIVDLSNQEHDLLNVYRSLDEKGRHTVNTVALMEYDRVQKENKKSTGTPASTKKTVMDASPRHPQERR